MAEGRPQNAGPWEEWRDFPDGPIKEAVEAFWDNNLASEEKVGAHFALQVNGTNPISGYRVDVV